jgi:RNA-directed DNA polymerase
MTGADKAPGAAPHDSIDWSQIDWDRAGKIVRRLQARIVKAVKEGRWGKARCLQHLLVHSYSGKVLAVKRVTTNRGKRTPGVDRETWAAPGQKSAAVHRLGGRGYEPLPLRRVHIPKSGKQTTRPLGIPAMIDRAMQALHLLALEPVAETTGDRSSYGFRRGRSTHDAIGRCFQLLARKDAVQWILDCDVKSCFDEISHEWLIRNIPMESRTLNKWLKAGFIDKSVFHPTVAGTPQGGIASPVLANMTLDGLQRILEERFPYQRGRPAPRVHLVRYADDLIVTGSSQELLENKVRPVVETFLSERGLRLSAEKTVVRHVDAGFDFLGMTVRKYRGTLLIRPSKKGVLSFLKGVRVVIKEHSTVTTAALIGMLNPMIRGWANYHRHVVSSATFSYVDHEIWRKLWRWAIRRHPNKGLRWVKAKYFVPHGGQQWVFTGTEKGADGLKTEARLFAATSVHIRRHILVRGDLNPFDPDWRDYLEQRRSRRLSGTGSRVANPADRPRPQATATA